MNELSTFSEFVQQWVWDHWGTLGVAVLALATIALLAWWKWDWEHIKTRPGVALLVERLTRLPSADPNRFSVAVALLDDDDGRAMERLILGLLRDFEGIQVLSFSRSVSTRGPVPEDKEREGHAIARRYLVDSGASVLIWGRVLQHGDREVPDLFVTGMHPRDERSRRYTIDAESDLRLPTVFWQDLSEVLRLDLKRRQLEFTEGHGRYLARELRQFASRVRSLLQGADARFGWDTLALATARRILADALLAEGIQTGEREPLVEAVSAYRVALQDYPRRQFPLGWAMIHYQLGIALRTLGEGVADTTLLEQATRAFRYALEEFSRNRVPLHWAMVHSELGVLLTIRGERQDSTSLLGEAVAAHDAALREFGRNRESLSWAITQDNRGVTLRELGERQSDTRSLEQAVAAHQETLQEFARDVTPIHWARAQHNLGVALRSLGGRLRDTALLEAAVSSHRAALEEYTRERLPQRWASAQRSLGNTLIMLGHLDHGTVRLEEAVQAHRAALEEFTRDRVPLHRARTQSNLGTALRILGEWTDDAAILYEAVEVQRSALEIFKHAALPRDIAITTRNLELAEAALSRIQAP